MMFVPAENNKNSTKASLNDKEEIKDNVLTSVLHVELRSSHSS